MSSSSSITAVPYESLPSPSEEHPAKRQKTLACLRCRRRKQKCDEQRPCANCARSGETCQEAGPRLGLVNSAFQLSHMSLTSPVDIIALEERVSRLEKAIHPAETSSLEPGRTGRGQHHQTQPSPPTRRRLSSSIPDAHDGAGIRAGPDSVWSSGSVAARQSSFSLAGSAPAIGLLATFARSDGADSHPQNLVHQTQLDQSQHSKDPTTAGGAVSVGAAYPSSPAACASFLDRATEDALFDIYRTKVHTRYAFLQLDALQDAARRARSKAKDEPMWTGFFLNMVYSIGLLLARAGGLPIVGSLDRSSRSSPAMSSAQGPYDQGLQGHSSQQQQHRQQFFYRLAVTRHLGHVFALPDRVLHVQAYLMLAMHALHSPCTERIISIAGATMRYCVMAQLHLAEAECDAESGLKTEDEDEKSWPDEPPSSSTTSRSQTRRRVFWSAYALDREVGAVFDLPCSIPDSQITTRMFANARGQDYFGGSCCTEEHATAEATWNGAPTPRPGCARNDPPFATALHLLRCRRIQSEILDITLHRDFGSLSSTQAQAKGDGSLDSVGRLATWQVPLVARLEQWLILCQRKYDADSHHDTDSRLSGFSSIEWCRMWYHLTKAMLFGPKLRLTNGAPKPKRCTKAAPLARLHGEDPDRSGDGQQLPEMTSATADAIARTLHACAHASLAYRRLQISGTISSSWLAAIAQFKCGVALLYYSCFFSAPGTPTATGDCAAGISRAILLRDVAEAVRACGIALSVLAEQWPQMRCMRDVFDLLDAELPIPGHYQPTPRTYEPGAAGPRRRRIGPEASEAVVALLPALEPVVVHRDTLRMVRDLATEEVVLLDSEREGECGGKLHVHVEAETDQGGGDCSVISADFEVVEVVKEEVQEAAGTQVEEAGIPSGYAAAGIPPDLVGGGAHSAFRPATPRFYMPELEGAGFEAAVAEQHHYDGFPVGSHHYDYLDFGFSAAPLDQGFQF